MIKIMGFFPQNSDQALLKHTYSWLSVEQHFSVRRIFLTTSCFFTSFFFNLHETEKLCKLYDDDGNNRVAIMVMGGRTIQN